MRTGVVPRVLRGAGHGEQAAGCDDVDDQHRNGRSMSTTTHEATLDADEVVARARSLKDLIRAQQDEAEELGHYTAAVHERMIELGLYHLLTPRRYGGYEVSLKSWLRAVIEISAVAPGPGWCYCL